MTLYRSRSHRRTSVGIWSIVAGALIAGGPARVADQSPKPTSLAEKVEKRLVQLDVSVEGDREAIRGITAKDFALYVSEHEVQGLIVDRLCGDASTPSGPPTVEGVPAEPQAPRVARQIMRARATFILFFDQPHLTTAGRALSLKTSRDLINRLIVNGARASIVSNAKRLETIVPLTGDREKLLGGLERLRQDPRQWDSYSDTERARAQQVRDAYDLTPDESKRCPPPLAKTYAREEFLIARQSTERLAIAVGALAETSAPKSLVYFGDSLRQKAGLHYLGIIPCENSPEVASAVMVPSAATEFDAVINDALARGVHFFTVQAEGLLAYRPGWDTERHQHAQDALVSLAAETGGEAFLGGASNAHIADRIDELTACRLLLSFPPGDLPRDQAMNVTLELHVPKVKIETQGRIVIPSPASIDKARLLAAFVDPASSDDGSLRAFLIPRGGDGKTWKAGVQLRLRPSGLPDSSADLGASIVRRDKVTDHFASSIATKSGAREKVLEKTLDIAPGEFSVVAVAHDAKRDDIGSSRLDADWPNPAKSDAAISPVAVLQAGPAAMSKDGALASTGSLARDDDEPLNPSIPISLVSVVCRGAKTHAPVVVERWIEDGSRGEFEPMTIAETAEPCVQTVDVLPAGRLKPGVVDYRVVARIGDEIVAQERRTLRAIHAR